MTGKIGATFAFTPDDDEDFTGTGTYIVVAVESTEDNFDLSVAYGPFDDIVVASEYGTRNFEFSWGCEIVNVDGAVTETPTVDPNQSTIADYIDPSVVE